MTDASSLTPLDPDAAAPPADADARIGRGAGRGRRRARPEGAVRPHRRGARTTHRLASCLVQERYLRVLPGVGYALGPKLIELGFQAREAFPLATLARPYLDGLAELTGDTIHLAVRDNDEVLYLEKIPGKKGLEMRSRVGHRMPLAATGVGKALLLDADEPQWKALHRVGGPVSSRAPGGQQGWEAFRERMRGYAAQGYAFDLEDNEPSIRCVAAPVRDASSGIVAAISVSSTVPYMSLERMDEMVPVVCDAAMRISAELGWIIPAAASARPGRPDAS